MMLTLSASGRCPTEIRITSGPFCRKAVVYAKSALPSPMRRVNALASANPGITSVCARLRLSGSCSSRRRKPASAAALADASSLKIRTVFCRISVVDASPDGSRSARTPVT
ncbi:Uncharacterised protein [Mycobacteroides abscessus subsp. abscessus]|nr:Uncharacterised protein [Mycobacteroides abscessus subsp. abscessus]